MNKQNLIDAIAQSQNFHKKEAKIVIDTIFETIIEALSEGDKVELRGFGSFRAKQRKERIARNPKTGEIVNVPSKRVPVFKAGKELKEMVDG